MLRTFYMLLQEGCYSGLLEAQPVAVDSNLSQPFIFNMFKALDEESQTQVSSRFFTLFFIFFNLEKN